MGPREKALSISWPSERQRLHRDIFCVVPPPSLIATSSYCTHLHKHITTDAHSFAASAPFHLLPTAPLCLHTHSLELAHGAALMASRESRHDLHRDSRYE
jgi:hypothetical protein